MEVISHKIGVADPKYGRGNLRKRTTVYVCLECWEKKFVNSDDEGLEEIELQEMR